MASIRSRGDRHEIRECRATAQGPRQVTLARFRGVLTPDVLDRAAAQAQRPFDRAAVMDRARAVGIATSETARSQAAHRLLAELQAGRTLDPTLVGLLRAALDAQPSEALPEHLEDAAEWLGRSEAERGKALRGLTRTASRVAQARAHAPSPTAEVFPRFSSTSTSTSDEASEADAA